MPGALAEGRFNTGPAVEAQRADWGTAFVNPDGGLHVTFQFNRPDPRWSSAVGANLLGSMALDLPAAVADTSKITGMSNR